jgi:RNA polymerase subunit RPABC4/transcription elongation factor Spt4
MIYKSFNRSKKVEQKKDGFWCKECEQVKVQRGRKCPLCGYREEKRKKYVPIIRDDSSEGYT